MNTPTRAALQQAFPSAPAYILQALEALFRTTDSNTTAIGTGASATQALQDATVLTLSPNDTFTQERTVEAGQGIKLTDTGTALIIAMVANLVVNGSFKLTINLPADSNLTVIQSGTIMIEEGQMPTIFSRNFANDAAAATGGVPVQGFYHNAGALRIRLT